MDMKRSAAAVAAVFTVLTAGGLPAAADAGISYTDTAWSTQAPAPDAYTAVDRRGGYQLADGLLSDPQDICTDEDGRLYIADTGNDRIVITDPSMSPLQIVTQVTVGGTADRLNAPRGVYVSGGYLYVADTGNGRVLKMSLSGEAETVYERPERSEFSTEFFSPAKVAVDRDGTVFVLCQGVYQGCLLYEAGGAFQGFFGSAQVQPSWQVVLDKVWKRLLSRKQRSGMADYVPVEYDGLVADGEGLIYVCSRNTDSGREQIRKLNYLGSDIFPVKDSLGEKTAVYYEQNSIVTTFTDVAVSDSGILYALDDTRGRVYAFDGEGRQLFVFGGTGEMMGTFQKASSLAVSGDTVYVLDSQNGTVSAFLPTEYGAMLIRATACFAEGRFEETRALWQELLSRNSNLELAYRGMGETLLQSGRYREAMRYFRLGSDPARESVAFARYRARWIRERPVVVSLGVLVLIVLSLVLTRKSFWRRRRAARAARAQKQYGPVGGTFRNVGQVLCHPVVTMTELKYQRYHSRLLVIGVAVWWFLVRIGVHEWTAFRFTGTEEDLNVFLELLLSVVPFFLFCLSNWACCSLLDGEGRFGEICTFTAMAMVPYLLFQTLGIPLSGLLSLAEEDLYRAFLLAGTLWSVFLLLQAVRICQQYALAKTVVLIVLSLFGIVVILFLLLLVVALVQQMYSFGVTLYSELSYRG